MISVFRLLEQTKLKKSKPKKTNIKIDMLKETYEMNPYSLRNVMNLLEEWEYLGKDTPENFDYVFSLLEDVYDYDTTNHVLSTINYINEAIVQSVRNASKFDKAFKSRLGKIGSRITGKVKAPYVKKLKLKKSALKAHGFNENQDIAKALDKLGVSISEQAYIDQIINNYESLHKRFSIQSEFTEDLPLLYAKAVDTYNISPSAKIPIAIESCIYDYALRNPKESYKINKTAIVNAITEAYMILYSSFTPSSSPSILEAKQLQFDSIKNSLVKGLEACKIVDSEDIKDAIKTLQTKNKEDWNTCLEQVLMVNPMQSHRMINEAITKEAVTDKLKKFLAGVEKSPEAFAKYVQELFKNDPMNFDQVSMLLRVCAHLCITVPAVAIHPLLGIPAAIVAELIKYHAESKACEKVYRQLKAECRKLDKQLKDEQDTDKKQKLKKLKSAVEDSAYRLEEEIDKTHTTDKAEKIKSKEADKDFANDDDFDFDFNFESAQDVSKYMNTIIEDVNFMESFDENEILSLVEEGQFKEDELKNLNELALNTTLINPQRLADSYDFAIKRMSKYNILYGEDRRKSIYEGYINYLDNTTPKEEIIYEMNLASKFKVIKDKLVSKLKFGDAKLRSACQDFDRQVTAMKDTMNRDMNDEARQAAIKGTIIPSFSRCFKLALASGALTLLAGPLIGLIPVVFWYVTVHINKKPQVQQLLDEIDIELVMVDRKINAAKDKDDNTALRSLLGIKKSLLRQRDRLRFRMHLFKSDNSANLYKDDNDDD